MHPVCCLKSVARQSPGLQSSEGNAAGNKGKSVTVINTISSGMLKTSCKAFHCASENRGAWAGQQHVLGSAAVALERSLESPGFWTLKKRSPTLPNLSKDTSRVLQDALNA
eukprot:scaffold126_cov246-Pinguiococcus_pyrenoidosus.AAC.4